ncbi:HSPB1-associated protein 1 isoform X2 [Parasteatoda tepidariorum]|uniref:HSPB1-associated protein 1 isoform X2 n=1 Tax=Parasteatoda tepidariorum TaxID=114398 RepID=UPI0039BD38FA
MMEDKFGPFPISSEVRRAVEEYLNVPTVFKGQYWTKTGIKFSDSIKNFREMFTDVLLDFRIVSNSCKGTSWEGDAQYMEATISQFIDWQHGVATPETPFYKFNKEKFWAYSSYNYMNIIFSKEFKMLQDMNWGQFGFPEITGKDSTFWLGSTGANTPCHVDSYGCNLIAQVFGRKKWVLFPPEDAKFLYPTRIPYEESSIFSSVNVAEPDLEKHPLFKKAHPYVVILENDEVLFVPKGWWHFVLNLDSVTVSVNTWIKLESDSSSHLAESATKVLMTALISSYEPEGEIWLNPKEELVSPDETLGYIISTLKELKNKGDISNCHAQDSKTKVPKLKKEDNVHSERCNDNIFSFQNIISVKSTSILKLYSKENEISSEKPQCDHEITTEKIINCFVHPDVIKISRNF